MKVKEIIRTTALLLGREDVTDYLDGKVTECGEQTEQTIKVLVDLLNLVISELSSTYIPAVKSEKVMFNNGKAYYKDFSERVLKILKVTDDAGNNIACTHHAQFLNSPVSSAIIEYQYLPKEAVLEGEICYAEKDVTPNVLAYGVLAEYQITQGSFDEAVMWHKRYAGGIETICFPQNVKSKSRRWV